MATSTIPKSLASELVDTGWKTFPITGYATGNIAYRKIGSCVCLMLSNTNFTGMTANADNVIASFPTGLAPNGLILQRAYGDNGFLLFSAQNISIHPNAQSGYFACEVVYFTA